MRVEYNYLPKQFADPSEYFADLRELVASGEFTLGPFVEKFERNYAAYVGVRHVISTNSGTDALILCLKALKISPGDEVITAPNTFTATVGAIAAVGARPVFVDVDDRYQIDATKIPAAITPRTKALLPVHWTGMPADMEAVLEVAGRQGLPVVEDACAAVGAKIDGRSVGTFGRINAFSMHPLKPINVWGDGGMVATDDDGLAEWLRVYRNHGLVDRDHIEFWGVNQRLQPVQAVVADRLLRNVEGVLATRLAHAARLDAGFRALAPNIVVPRRDPRYREVYQIYVVRARRRDALVKFLIDGGVEAKVHYPIPLHLQRAASSLGYGPGAFPECERQAAEIVTLPAHQHLSVEQIDYMIGKVGEFYRSAK